MKASDIARQAADLVAGDRAEQYGDMLATHQAIADVWNAILLAAGKPAVKPLDAHDVANLMEGLKIVRRYRGPYSPDSYVDGAGYAACAGEIKSRMVSAASSVETSPRPG